MKRIAILALILTLAACSAPQPSAAPSNGKAIFETGKDAAGIQITAAHRPLYPSCAACHRTNGAGGVRLPGGVKSADLRYASLVTRQKHPYTPALLERAISQGIDNEGKPLDAIMPRWRMSAQDLSDVARYVISLR